MGLQPGDMRFEEPFSRGPFSLLQPAFYWACERDPDTFPDAPCDLNLSPGTSPGNAKIPTEYSFNFDEGFVGTDENTKQFYVMVYYRPLPGRVKQFPPLPLGTEP